MSDFLIELMSEEMPASLIEDSALSIEQILKSNIKKNNLVFKNSEFFYSTKRLTYIFYDIKPLESEVTIKGPSLEAPIKAVQGFAKSNNTTLDELKKNNTKNGNYYFFNKKVSKLEVHNILMKILETNLHKIPWKKSMRWGNNTLRWIRPLKNILCLYDKKLLKINLLGFHSNNFTLNSNPLIDKKIFVKSIDDYIRKLKNVDVIIDHRERKKIISDELHLIAKKNNLELFLDQKLLNEVINLVERPVLFLAKFDKKYLKLPAEVLITSMKKNQKYFPLYKKNKKLSNYFIIVSNLKPSDGGNQIIHGNQCVIEARLEDAAFFWDKDNNSNFREKTEELRRIVYHNKLGSIYEKVDRIINLINFLANALKVEKQEKKDLITSATICKNDLTTELVREFPVLQGTMGYHYSKNSGFNLSVSMAIKDYYKPYGPKDSCPETKESKILAIADKIDTLAGFFLIELGPTSSKDPFALRRAGLGIIRILIEGKISFNLENLIEQAISLFKKNNSVSTQKVEDCKNKIINFILERFENLMKNDSVEKSFIFKCLNIDKNNINLIDLHKKSEILNEFVNTKTGENFLIAFKRVVNILENSKEKVTSLGQRKFDISLSKSNFELELNKITTEYLKKQNLDFSDKLSLLESFTKPINDFFQKVQINDENIILKINRLCLLSDIKNILMQTANFSKIIKGKEL